MGEKILFLLTGGTIDSKTKGRERDVLFEHSNIPDYLLGQKINKDLEFVETIWKDSRDVTDDDRRKILKIIEKNKSLKVIITHGTFTMPETGKFLKKNLARKDQIVILTGAVTPLLFKDSDAPLNLEFSLEKSESLSPGIYICMNGLVLNPEEAVKDIKTEKFYSAHKIK